MEISAFARRQRADIGAGEIWMASAEDVILAKLRWFRKGGEVSEKQWRDVPVCSRCKARAWISLISKQWGYDST